MITVAERLRGRRKGKKGEDRMDGLDGWSLRIGEAGLVTAQKAQ